MSDINKLYDIKIMEKWSKFICMFEKLSVQNEIHNILPDHYYDKCLLDLEEANKEISLKDKSLNYLQKFNYNQKIFCNLFPAKINGLSFRVF